MTVYTVWTRDEYEADLLAIFTDEAQATACAERHDGRVLRDLAFATADEADAFEGFDD